MSKAEDAARDFEHCVWPIIQRVAGGQLRQVETQSGTLATELDAAAGIDAYVKTDRGTIETWACRIQWRDYRGHRASYAGWAAPLTFTVRKNTELPARQQAIRDGALFPRWTLQAYMESVGGDVECVGWILTTELYEWISRYGYEAKTHHNPEDGTPFLAVPFKKVSGYRFFREPPRAPDLFSASIGDPNG